eukprot:scaffold102724_cov29-Tisochrysis_lutea.AAC.5
MRQNRESHHFHFSFLGEDSRSGGGKWPPSEVFYWASRHVVPHDTDPYPQPRPGRHVAVASGEGAPGGGPVPMAAAVIGAAERP